MKADPRPRSAHHLYQGLMIDVWNDGVLGSLPVKMGEQEKNARQSFLAEIAALIHQVLLLRHVPSQPISAKQV